ncbi:hypothetical protein [Seohaeicola zhoushanensis]|uniref:Uncharacterized protein n=1 Tax=Seohaeicola zhoushanensis TaxID=1569283 RepID=A0A8J3GUM3_9RHOB|nr:hypothetical protein [Seohaeicola zhoushanensis]GHF39757.1 hypothetical protein GCM10017056_09090 [Seohaeicola zhoushanensis]
MQSLPGIATPLEDVAAWQRQRGELPARDRLTPDLLALAQNGATILIGAQLGGRPTVGFGVCCRALPDGQLRILLSRSGNANVLAAIAEGSRVAATFTGAPSHRAFQVKAERAVIGAATQDDRPEAERQAQLFCDGLTEIGFTRDLAAGWLALDLGDLAAIELLPERVFTQTPGPGAGAELPR